MSKMILVVEDEASIADLIRLYLEKADYQVLLAADGGTGIQLFRESSPDLVILDVMLPVMDGWQVCAAIRETSKTPIIMLTAKEETDDKVHGLELGADDYITKPFDLQVFVSRAKATLRRAHASDTSDMLSADGVSLDLEGYNCSVDGVPVDMPAKEFELLDLLMTHPGKVYGREKLLQLVWGADFPGDERTVDVHIRRLREKIEPNPSEPIYVQTKWGVGYYYKEHAAKA